MPRGEAVAEGHDDAVGLGRDPRGAEGAPQDDQAERE